MLFMLFKIIILRALGKHTKTDGNVSRDIETFKESKGNTRDETQINCI